LHHLNSLLCLILNSLFLLLAMYSELRQDLVTGDWIVVVPGRAKGHVFVNNEERVPSPIESCPFETLPAQGADKTVLDIKNGGDWSVQIVPNIYPAVRREELQFSLANHGPYAVLPGVGQHDILVTRDHNKNFPDLPPEHAFDVFAAFKERYLMLAKEKHLAYVAIFNNWGPKAGATLYHPHSQIIALPIVPPDVGHSLRGSQNYFDRNNTCVHCVMIEFEIKEKARVLYENDCVIAFTPYISRSPFEMRIFPKAHLPYFEDSDERVLKCVVDALQISLRALRSTLNDPDYNFFIHTSPIKDRSSYGHYHWHLEIIPRVKINAGFEYGTGIDVNFVDPDEAAKLLYANFVALFS